MQDILDRRISLGFGLAVTALSALLLTSIWLNAQRKSCAGAVTHAQKVLTHIAHLRLDMSQTQSHLRGYLLTGEAELLESAGAAIQDTNQTLQELNNLTEDNAEQGDSLTQVIDQMSQLKTARKEELDHFSHKASIQQSVMTEKKISAQIERAITTLEIRENRLQNQRLEHLHRQTTYSGCVSLLLCLGLFGLLGVLYRTIRYDRILRHTNAALLLEASTDVLTGLKNRRALDKQLDVEFQRAARHERPLACLLLDVDRFKQYNDAYGHPAGDRALQQVGAILQANARLSDTTARYGGEEFAVLLPETDAEGAMEVAERLRLAIADYPWNQQPITVSIGIACLLPGMESAADLMEHVDQALYAAKGAGRNRVERFIPSVTLALVSPHNLKPMRR